MTRLARVYDPLPGLGLTPTLPRLASQSAAPLEAFAAAKVAQVNTGPGGLAVDAALAFVATALGSLFAAGDAALSEIPEGRMQALSAEPGSTGQIFRMFVRDPLRILSRWLVARVVALSIAAVLFDQVAHRVGVERMHLPIAVLGAVLTYGTFAEVLCTFARRRPEFAAARALILLRPLEILVIPLADPLAVVGRAVRRRVPKARKVDARITETEVEWAVSEGEKAGAIANEPAEMIRKVLDFKDLTAREVMVPRRLIVGIEAGTPLSEVVAFVASEKHSRYPVYRDHLDNVVGLLSAKDLFGVVRDQRLTTARLSEIVRTPVMFVSENQPVAKILQDMRSRRLHMAIVSDEFGGTAGVVTLEDILEEIVGDIRDEHDGEAPIQAIGDGRVVADGSVPLTEVAQALGKPLPDDGDAESLGGLIVSKAGRVPNVGAIMQVGDFKLIVREADKTRVVKVEIVPERAPAPTPAA
jgi:CBS domain containing-hemolysin-like protein